MAMIGPEGGFSESELNMIERADAQTLSLSPHILRTETAAVASAVHLFSMAKRNT